jgi:L-ascorbate metabolism protein UlaG (beta-lactamase superfamily)
VPTVTWLGHATVSVEADGRRLLTDPTVTARIAHLRRRRPVPPGVLDRPVDAVVITHVHLDHLHLPSLRRVAPTGELVVPRGAGPLVTSIAPGRVTEVVEGDAVDLGFARLQVVHAEHLAGRGPHSRVRAEPVGYVIEAAGRRVYVAGDTDLFPAMHDLGPVDLAVLPIWGWGPTLGERHLDPGTAAEATARIAPARVMAYHWGTYSPVRIGRGAPAWLDRPIEAFREALGAAGLADRLVPVVPGGRVDLEPVPPS